MKKTYYIANNEYADNIYGSDDPICIDRKEVNRLAREWDMTAKELLDQMHEASKEEIETYGKYDTPRYKCVIWSNSSHERTYNVHTRSAYKAAQELGRCDGGEIVEIRTASGNVISRAAYTPEDGGKYYRCEL